MSSAARADTTRNESLTDFARAGADAFGYRANLEVERGLAQLLRLRVAQLNSCVYCLSLHHEVAREAGIPQAKVDTLGAWWETDLFTEAERAALEYAEALTRIADSGSRDGFQTLHDALAGHFGADEVLEIIGIVVNMNVWTRLKRAEGAGARRAP